MMQYKRRIFTNSLEKQEQPECHVQVSNPRFYTDSATDIGNFRIIEMVTASLSLIPFCLSFLKHLDPQVLAIRKLLPTYSLILIHFRFSFSYSVEIC